jgi:hypothetical protein
VIIAQYWTFPTMVSSNDCDGMAGMNTKRYDARVFVRLVNLVRLVNWGQSNGFKRSTLRALGIAESEFNALDSNHFAKSAEIETHALMGLAASSVA